MGGRAALVGGVWCGPFIRKPDIVGGGGIAFSHRARLTYCPYEPIRALHTRRMGMIV